MVAVTLATLDGQKVVLNVPIAGDGASSFVFAMPKSGSSLLNQLVTELAETAARPCINVPSALFSAGVPAECADQRDLAALFSSPGYIFTGFRRYEPCFELLDLSENPKILLVRDPRDILVSYYFSIAQSHIVPAKGATREKLLEQRTIAIQTDVDAYVLSNECEKLKQSYENFIDKLLPQQNLTVYRYEDVIFRKRWWVADIGRRLGLHVGIKNRWQVARRNDIRPAKENPDQHIRQVRPGNFRQHLRPETILEIERRYATPMECFGYRPASLKT